jgi:hypothetical protein
MGELGMTKSTIDDDIPDSSPIGSYAHPELTDLVERQPLTQSIYLITPHSTSFAIDYPITIKPIKNPNPERFNAAYQAVSLVPAFPLDRITYATTGNPDWTESELAHYTKQHPDVRYAEKAQAVSRGARNDIEKAFFIQEYFNKNAIYTLSPDHKIRDDQDPVAPFLFGDLRGYCVHFAHASVYMLRSLGIPARIATGYLTDLSQSKDGHTLLRMNDRHSWPEVYITERGWIPFDVMPEQVESHANSEINMKLLEELMDMLEPGEEILPEDLLEDEEWANPPSLIYTPTWQTILLTLTALLLAFAVIKLYLLHSWRLTKNPPKRLKLAYRSILVQLYDLGITRISGETRLEFSYKLTPRYKLSELNLTQPLLELAYHQTCSLQLEQIGELYRKDTQQLRQLSWKRRLRASLNPAAVLAYLGGKSW